LNFLRRAYLELIGYAGTMRRFREACEAAFGYLVSEFGFGPPTYEVTGYGALTRFEKPNSIVEIHLDWREERVFVYLRPGPQGETRTKIEPPGVLLDAIVVHQGATPPVQEHVTGPRRLRKVLEEYAAALRLHVSDALRGDFDDVASVRAAFPESRWRTWRL
jgi:hypothetical protein